jgi:hypothetical protein
MVTEYRAWSTQVESEVRRHLQFDAEREGHGSLEERSGPLRTDELLSELRKWKVRAKLLESRLQPQKLSLP